MSLIGGSPRGSPVYTALSFRLCSTLTSITLIGSQDLWFDYLPPNTVNRARFPVGSPLDFRMWESFRTMPLGGGFSRVSPVFSRLCILALLHSHLTSHSWALKTSMLRATQISSRTYSPLAGLTSGELIGTQSFSDHGEPSSITGEAELQIVAFGLWDLSKCSVSNCCSIIASLLTHRCRNRNSHFPNPGKQESPLPARESGHAALCHADMRAMQSSNKGLYPCDAGRDRHHKKPAMPTTVTLKSALGYFSRRKKPRIRKSEGYTVADRSRWLSTRGELRSSAQRWWRISRDYGPMFFMLNNSPPPPLHHQAAGIRRDNVQGLQRQGREWKRWLQRRRLKDDSQYSIAYPVGAETISHETRLYQSRHKARSQSLAQPIREWACLHQRNRDAISFLRTYSVARPRENLDARMSATMWEGAKSALHQPWEFAPCQLPCQREELPTLVELTSFLRCHGHADKPTEE
ncbi:hypothetical protein PR048_014316 [Dryococelus australis]|uniref:Uncharacterized protein n=1 Tax=Dryococelus australis TaxID=614101 RepID=A0ABQ9HE31_9NEOP|nr:hypothetical protein PR048_014316 [Dryococelus australis]